MNYEIQRYVKDPETGEVLEYGAFDTQTGWRSYRHMVGSLEFDGVALYLDGTKLASWGVVE